MTELLKNRFSGNSGGGVGGGETAFLALGLDNKNAFCFHCDFLSQKCVFGKLSIFILPVFAAIISFQFPLVFG